MMAELSPGVQETQLAPVRDLRLPALHHLLHFISSCLPQLSCTEFHSTLGEMWNFMKEIHSNNILQPSIIKSLPKNGPKLWVSIRLLNFQISRQRITEVLLWTLGYLHACMKPSSVQPKAPWHSTLVCSPLPLPTHLSPPPVPPTEAEWDLLWKEGSWAWLSSGSTARGWAAPALLRCCSGGKAVWTRWSLIPTCVKGSRETYKQGL